MARILAVDDDLDILLVVESALETAGHDVTTCSDPRTVRQTISEQRPFDAIVLDVMMPGLSGYDLLSELRRLPESRRIPILFLSARADSDARVRALREGADDFLAKPFVPDELILRVEQLASRGSTAMTEKPPVAPSPSLSNLQQTLRQRRVVGEVYLGRYQALEVIGEGAMGLVFRGWDPRLRRQVALKTLRFESLLDNDDHRNKVAQLLLEATTVARFSHPNLVAVYDVGEGTEVPFIAMEYVEGVSLSDYLEIRGRLPTSKIIPLAEAVAKGLAAAHDRHIVHQDIKPGNILLGRDASIKLTDFGVAKLLNSISRQEKKLFGTPGYLPPEALRGQGCGPRGDLFSLGSVLFECLTGTEAFAGRDLRDRILKTLKQDLPEPREIVSTVPEELSLLVHELLAKEPEDRPASAEDVAQRLTAMNPTNAVWSPDLQTLEMAEKRSRPAPESRHSAPISSIDLDLDCDTRAAS